VAVIRTRRDIPTEPVRPDFLFLASFVLPMYCRAARPVKAAAARNEFTGHY